MKNKNKNKNVLTLDILTVDEFRQVVIQELLDLWAAWTPQGLAEFLISEGMPILNANGSNIIEFVTEIGTKVELATFAVDTEDGVTYWIVSGRNAIRVNRP